MKLTTDQFGGSRINTGWFLLLCVCFLITRIIFLDSDLPPFDIFNYQPIDELWYNNAAFNLFHYQDLQHKILPYVASDSITPNFFGNIISFITLSVFGNNYYGLRMASVVAAFGVFLTFYLTLRNYLVRYNANSLTGSSPRIRFITIACMFYLIFDFSFLLASRVSEPTIFRMFSLSLMLYFFSSGFTKKHIESIPFTALAGFMAFATIFYVYPSNAFILPATWGVCIIAGWKKGFKRTAIHTLVFAAGGIVCFVSYELVLRIFFGKSYIDQIVAYSVFVDRVNLPVAGNTVSSVSLIKKFLLNIFGIFSTNIFRLNPVLLVLFLASIPVYIAGIIKKRSLPQIFLGLLLAFFFLQLIFINDYYYRKLVMLLPMVVLFIAIAVNFYPTFMDDVARNKRSSIIYNCYLLLVTLFSIAIFLINCYKPLIGKDVLLDQKWILGGAFILQIVYWFLIEKKIISRYYVSVTIALLLIPSLYLGSRYIFFNPTYTYRDTMIQLSKYVDGQIVVGGLANGFRLYNSSLPVLDAYGYKFTEKGTKDYKALRDRIVGENRAKYTILYEMEGENLFYAINKIYKGRLEPVFRFKLGKDTAKSDEPITLYRYIKK